MPCGYRDQRRQSFRCLHCRLHHSKCDRQRPCAPCKRRNLKCEDPLSREGDITLIEYARPVSYESIGRILKDDSWLYVRIFFDAVSSSDVMLISAFGFEEIGQFIQDGGPVFDAVATVGALYGNQSSADLRLSPDRLTALRKFCATFRQHIRARIQKPYALQDTSLLLCIQVLVILELMIDKTPVRWAELFQLLLHTFASQKCTLDVSDGVKSSFFSFIRLCLAFRDLMFYEHVTSLAGFMKARRNIPVLAGPQKQYPTTPAEKTESLTRMIDFWAELKIRSLEWSRSIAELPASDLNPAKLCSSQVQEGLEIVDQACRFQQEVIAAIFISKKENPDSDDLVRDYMVPFYHWILAGLCRMFSKPAWVSLGWKLPVMHETLMKDQNLTALIYAEKFVEKGQLGAIFYAPISSVVGVELSSVEDRSRVLRFLQKIKDTGFAVASALEYDLRLSWGKNGENVI